MSLSFMIFFCMNLDLMDLVYFTIRALDTNAIQVRQECYANNTCATQVGKFDFDNGTNENIL